MSARILVRCVSVCQSVMCLITVFTCVYHVDHFKYRVTCTLPCRSRSPKSALIWHQRYYIPAVRVHHLISHLQFDHMEQCCQFVLSARCTWMARNLMGWLIDGLVDVQFNALEVLVRRQCHCHCTVTGFEFESTWANMSVPLPSVTGGMTLTSRVLLTSSRSECRCWIASASASASVLANVLEIRFHCSTISVLLNLIDVDLWHLTLCKPC